MSGGPYPVMMWVHGGGYQQGANIMYPGYFLAGLKDVVVVVPNYRLGVLGKYSFIKTMIFSVIRTYNSYK